MPINFITVYQVFWNSPGASQDFCVTIGDTFGFIGQRVSYDHDILHLWLLIELIDISSPKPAVLLSTGSS